MRDFRPIVILVLALLLMADLFGGAIVSSKVDRVTYVYEKDEGAVPAGIAAALMALNTSGEIIATEYEDDIVDGDGEVPDQYKIAAKAADESGIPCLVIQAGERVVRVMQTTKETTLEQVLEAVR